jgi:putative glutamine amidotransferase
MTAPRIGITGITRLVSGVERTGVNASYVLSVLRGGGVPLVLSPLIGTSHNAALLEALDGLVLSGGEDVAPERYGATAHAALGDVDPVRDAFELELFRDARERELPVLAICRGIQLVNVALGGSLWQDIPSERPGALPHFQSASREARTHAVKVVPGTCLARALGATRLEVNSFHHQSIRELAPGLLVSACAPDGEIEGAESRPGESWLLAVQWHPEEFHRDAAAPEQGLFRELVRAAAARRECEPARSR